MNLLAGSRGAGAGDALPISVRVTDLREEVVATVLRYAGMVKELQKVELSFRVPGTVQRLRQVEGPGERLRNVHEGDLLPRGTVIAQLDPEDFRRDRGMAAERLASAEAWLVQARSDAELAEIEYRRAEQLSRRNAISTSEVDASRSKMRTTGALSSASRRDVESARIALEQAEAGMLQSWPCPTRAFIPISLRRFPPLQRGGQGGWSRHDQSQGLPHCLFHFGG
jgi:multidrug efflux pump subunit AcrA (membrane-fusion protein)